MTLDPEQIDLLSLTQRLAAELGSQAVPGSYLVGKTTIRDLLLTFYGCSELEAEQLVDTLIAQGFLRFRTARETEDGWLLEERSL
jgi:hypothetical protein